MSKKIFLLLLFLYQVKIHIYLIIIIDVANFVISGGRLAVPSSMPVNYAKLMTACWAQDPDKRPSKLIIYIFDYNIN